ncbi:MAG: hypothetical protein KKA42_16870 [candidate division Zixibacteria bacterium]|nr:hypothetical protein [candidate division Zixibacteria bacterium]
MITRVITLIVILLALAAPAMTLAQILPGQAVTYGNFDYVYSVASSMSRVYFATTSGVTVYDKIARRWEDPLNGGDGLRNQTVRRLWVDQFDQKLYIATDAGYYEYDLLFERWYPIPELPELDLDYDYVGPPDMWLTQFDANYHGEGRFVDIYGRTFYANAIINDRVGNLWIGTWGRGAARSDVASTLMELLPFGLLQADVRTILHDDTLIWTGGKSFNDRRTGLSALNPETNAFSYIESGISAFFPATDVNCLATTKDRIFVGTTNGVYTIGRKSQRVDGPLNRNRGLPDNDVRSLLVLNGALWVGTTDGLVMVELATDSVFYVVPDQLRQGIIYDLEAEDSALWIGSETGAYRLKPGTGRLQRFEDKNQVLFSRVYDIDRAGTHMWFCADDGLVDLDLTTGKSTAIQDQFQPFVRRPLAANDIMVATASNFGMTIYFLDQESKPYRREFTVDDGLASETVNALELDGDYIWIGSDVGLTRFWWNNPDRVD